jgi:N-acetylglucosamine malate deacetylase 2
MKAERLAAAIMTAGETVLMTDTLLFSYAHPDDESFLGAGLAARCRAEGRKVVLVTATRGDEGSAGTPPLCTRSDLPARREAELREAAAIAGMNEVRVLGYRDRALADADPAEIRRQLVALIRSHRPAIVVTFDPNGFNQHPDHVAISRFTSEAVAAAADGRWCPDAGAPHDVQRVLWTPPLTPADAADAAALPEEPGIDFVIDTSRWRDIKAAALRAHRTQHVSIEKHFFSHRDVDRILSFEAYRHASGPTLSRRPCDDVWAGLV